MIFMGLFGLSKPNVDNMMKKGDVNGLIRLLGSKDPLLRKRAAESLASSLALKEKPETLDDVKKIVGRYAQMFTFEQRGDFVFIKIGSYFTRMKELSSRESGQIHRRIERVFKEVGGTKPHNIWPLCVPLYKPSNSLQKGDKRMYLNIDEREMIAVELGKFGDDLAVNSLLDYASVSPLTAIQALSDIGGERAIETLRSMLYNHYKSSVWVRSYLELNISDPSYEEREMIFALEKAIINYRDYEGCKEIIKAYSKLFDYFDREERDKSKHLVLRTFKQIIGKNEILKDRELLMILLKCLGAFPADSSRTWLDNYYEQETDDYGNSSITEKKLIADHIGRYDDSKVVVSHIITLEQFKEYMRNLDLELLKDEEVLNYLVTLIAEYPNTLEGNPIAIALQRIDPKTRIFFLNRYMTLCKDWIAHGGFSWSPSKERNEPNVFDVIDSLKHWLSIWEK
jgi:hypothetical protein